jgi:FkbM family methyltransferase
LPVRVQVGGNALFVDLRSAIGRGMLVTGRFDDAVARVLRAELRPGGVYVDVGANVGVFSLLGAECVSDHGVVHAFEVDPRALRCLRRTQRTNRLTNLVVHAVALGADAGLVCLEQSDDVGLTFVSSERKGGTLFPLLPLDAWFTYFQKRGLDVLKIDVEGSELEVLRGARKVIECCRPVVVCEAAGLQERFGALPDDIVRFMANLRYRVSELENANDMTFVFRTEAASE